MVYMFDLKNELSGLKSDFPKIEVLEYKPLELYIVNYLIDSWTQTNSIFGGNV